MITPPIPLLCASIGHSLLFQSHFLYIPRFLPSLSHFSTIFPSIHRRLTHWPHFVNLWPQSAHAGNHSSPLPLTPPTLPPLSPSLFFHQRDFLETPRNAYNVGQAVNHFTTAGVRIVKQFFPAPSSISFHLVFEHFKLASPHKYILQYIN